MNPRPTGAAYAFSPGAEQRLREERERVLQTFAASVHRTGIVDVALIGNSSGLYPWELTPFVDIDVCLFVDALDSSVGSEIVQIGDELSSALQQQDIDFEQRIVRGPYKGVREVVERPVIVAHLGVFTEASYLLQSPFLRWGWRKYRCVREAERLRRLAPSPPTPEQLLNGPRGVRARLQALESGRVEMHEWCLPGLDVRSWWVEAGDVLFAECCFAAGATCARNHGRALGRIESDTLPNRDYFDWYGENLLASAALSQLMRLKSQARSCGYAAMSAPARELATKYLSELAASLEAGLR